MAAVTSPQNRFARPRNKPYRSFLHHWNKRQILPSGNALTSVKQTGDMCHPPEEVCVGVKGERAVLHTPLPRDILAAPAPAFSIDHCKEGPVSTAAEGGNQCQDCTEVFS